MRRSIRTFRVGYFAGAFPKAAPVNGLPGVLEQHPQLILGDLAVELVGPADTGQTGAQPGPRRVPLRRVVPGRRRSLSGATAVASSSHIRDQGVHRAIRDRAHHCPWDLFAQGQAPVSWKPFWTRCPSLAT